MKRRVPGRNRMNDFVLRELQRVRLKGIARGEIDPACDREGFFLWSLEQGHRPKYADFILPPLLYLEEQARLEMEGEGATQIAEG